MDLEIINSIVDYNKYSISQLESERNSPKIDIDEEENSPELPREVWIFILGHLTEPDLLSIANVNVMLYNLSQDNFLWKPLYIKKWNVITLPHRNRMMVDPTDYSYLSIGANCLTNQPTPYVNIFNLFPVQQSSWSSTNNNLFSHYPNNNTQKIYKLFTPKMQSAEANEERVWKLLYKERKQIIQDGGVEEFYHLLSTLIAFPLEFNRKAMMTMYTIVFQLCIVNYRMKGVSLPPSNLYRMLVECCHNHLYNMLVEGDKVPTGRPLIQYYLLHWNNYIYSIKRVNIVFRYFYRDWISKQNDEVGIRPAHLHIKGSSWWKKLLNGTDLNNATIVNLTIMMARGWMSVFLNGLQQSDCFDSIDSSNNFINNPIVDDTTNIQQHPNRLMQSIEMCNRDEDYSLVYSFLISVLHLQELLIYIGEETPAFVGNMTNGNNNNNTNNTFDLTTLTKCPLCNMANSVLPVLCDDQMNKIAKKCFAFLHPTANININLDQ